VTTAREAATSRAVRPFPDADTRTVLVQLDLNTLTKAELVQLAAEAGLSTGGTKQALIDRLSGSAPAADPPECSCGPGETCGDHLPVPGGWPEDLPRPDLAVPSEAPPLRRTHAPDVPPVRDGEVRRVAGQCFAAFRVAGHGRVEGGVLLDDALINIRGMALAAAIGQGLRARTPRLATWVADPDGRGGVATIAMTVKGG
jgi:hypothetical protein